MTEDIYLRLNKVLQESAKESSLKDGVLEEWEVESIIIAFFQKRGEKGGTEEEVVRLIKWCEEQRIGAALVDLVCKGYVSIDWSEVENLPVFGITDEGVEVFTNEEKNNGASN